MNRFHNKLNMSTKIKNLDTDIYNNIYLYLTKKKDSSGKIVRTDKEIEFLEKEFLKKESLKPNYNVSNVPEKGQRDLQRENNLRAIKYELDKDNSLVNVADTNTGILDRLSRKAKASIGLRGDVKGVGFVIVTVPADAIPGEIVERKVHDLTTKLFKINKNALYCGETVKFMVTEDMKEGTDIILFCRANNNDTNDVNFQSIDKVYNYVEIKKYIDEMTVSDLLDPTLMNGFKLIMNHFDPDTIDHEEDLEYSRGIDVSASLMDSLPLEVSPSTHSLLPETDPPSPQSSSPRPSDNSTTVPLPLPGKTKLQNLPEKKKKSKMETIKSFFNMSGGADDQPRTEYDLGNNGKNIMFVRHTESGSNRMKAMLNEIGIDGGLKKQLEPILTGFTTPYLTKRGRLQAFNHGFNVLPEYLKNNPDITNLKMYC